MCGKIGGNTATLLEKAFKWALSSTQAHFWWLSCSFCFTLRDRIMMRWHYSQGKSIPASWNRHRRKNSLLFIGNACAAQSQKFKEVQSFCSSSFSLFVLIGPLFGVTVVGSLLFQGAIDPWKARDVKYAPFGELGKGCGTDVCSTRDSWTGH